VIKIINRAINEIKKINRSTALEISDDDGGCTDDDDDDGNAVTDADID